MSSLLTLLALSPAWGAQQTVSPGANGSAIQTALDTLCASAQPNTLTFPPGELIITGVELVYPNPDPAAACVPNPGDITIIGNAVQGSSLVVRPNGANHVDLFTFGKNLNVTMRGIDIRGFQLGDPNSDAILSNADLSDRLPTNGTICAGLPGMNTTRAILVDGSDVTAPGQYTKLTVEDMSFTCLFAPDDGGAILVDGGSLTIRNSLFLGNQAVDSGGAVAVRHGGNVDRFNVDPSVPTLDIGDGSRFDRNASSFGGAASNTAALNSSVVRDSYFLFNVGEFGAGGLQLNDQASILVERNQFNEQNNEQFDINQRGGALAVQSADSMMFKNNIVCGSWAGKGGALYVDSVSEVDVIGSVFAENGAIEFGGGVYFEDSLDQGTNIRVVNNTFAGNEAGRLPEFLNVDIVSAIGGGGAATFFGVNPIFQNNVVAFTGFGGGVFGHYVPFTTNGYQIGDPLVLYNNIFYQNNDGVSPGHVTGDFAASASHPSNVLDVDPQMLYLGLGEFNCVPDAFYTTIDSPVVNAGGGPPDPSAPSVPTTCVDRVDTTVPPDFIHDADDGPCDIGAFGGEFALWRKDSDLDGVPNLFDCNDLDATIAPGQPEICDFSDNDCNGIVDDNLDILWYVDVDQDGFGDENSNATLTCSNPGGGLVANKDDCDDADATVFLDNTEICDGKDNNCNMEVDEGLPLTLWYLDSDGDQYGANSSEVETCNPPGGNYVQLSGDCADNDPTRFPGASEPCDGIDNDCDGLVDAEDEDATGVESFYPDLDGDGYGDLNEETRRCADDPPPAGISVGGDCDDTNPDINAGAKELCLQLLVDEDCDGVNDEVDANTLDALKVFADTDGDGVGSSVVFQLVCAEAPPVGFVLLEGDCDDNDPNIGECQQPCGCSASMQGPGGLLMVFGALFGVVARRRRC